MRVKQGFAASRSSARPYTWFIGDKLVTWTAFWSTIPISILIALAFVNPNKSSARDVLTWIAIALFSHASMAPFVHYLNKRGSLRVHFFVTFFLGALKGSVLNLIAPLFMVSDSVTIYERAFNSGIVLLYIFSAVSIIKSIWGKFERDLREVLAGLVSGYSLSADERSKNRNLIDDTQRLHTIEKLGQLLQDSVARSTEGLTLAQQAQAIDRVIAKNIRPKSSERWKEAELIWPQISPWRVLIKSLTDTKAPIFMIMVILAPLSIIGQFSYGGAYKSLFINVVSFLLLIILGALADQITRSLRKNILFNNMLYILIFLFIHQPTLLYTNYSLDVFSADEIGIALQVQMSSAISAIVFSILATVILSVYSSREKSLEQLQSILPENKLREALKAGITSNAESEYAQYLHSNVQAQLTASKLLLLKAAETNFSSMSISTTQEVLSRLELLKVPYVNKDVRPPQARLNELVQTWIGLARIRMDLPTELSEVSKNGEVISQLIEELVINAIRHGKAKNVRVRVSIIDGTCHISVQDDGKLKSTKKQGLGSTFFEVFAPDWKIGKNKDGTLATLTTPF
jgi:signal transduction histidine kinase